MALQKTLRKKTLYKSPRYWYHISSTLNRRRHYLTPWDNSKGFNRGTTEPDVKRTCVAPSIEHCLAAVPYSPGEKFTIYRTAYKTIANQPQNVFDSKITFEGWIQKPMMFVKIGTLSLPYVAQEEQMDVIEEAASSDSPQQSGKVLAWWKRRRLHRYIKSS